MSIKIIDYKAGNAPSVMCAVNFLGYNAEFARYPKDLDNASYLILPGVGSAKATMDSLSEMDLLNKLEDSVLDKKTPFLGICVGMQILFEFSEEESADCLGWLGGRVVKFDAANVKVPQMGWNNVKFTNKLPIKARDDFYYFVNSYFAKPNNEADIWGTADYDGTFTAAVHRDNIYGTQFHCEKSGEAGLVLLKSFLNIRTGENQC